MRDTDEGLSELVEFLTRGSPLTRAQARHVIGEVLDYLDERPEDFVIRRHAELQRAGLRNPEIYARLQAELSTRRFSAPNYSERQLRRLIYG